MKRLKYKNILYALLSVVILMQTSCNDELDIAPPSSIIPENYLNEESQLTSYVVRRYGSLPGSGADIPYDNDTDNAAGMSYSSLYTDGDHKVGEGGGDWSFDSIYQSNYFLETVLPKYENGTIEGNKDLIKHNIGEMYLLRAVQYFYKLKALGDFPIVRTTLTDNKEMLISKSKREPRNEVARFIISDLDSAFLLMSEKAPDGNKNRMSKAVAQLFKSRVALYEGTWLKYFKGTAFVPNGKDWPGAQKDYNKDYQYPLGDIDSEIKWFLKQAMDAADYVASQHSLTENTGVIPQAIGDSNPFIEMFSADDMSKYDEILLWKDYDNGLSINHNRVVNAGTSNQGVGMTRGYIQSFLMKDGKPYYASNLYKGDNHHSKIIENRDDRIRLFLKVGGQQIIWENLGVGSHGVPVEPLLPNIVSGSPMFRYNTGFTSRKYSLGDHARYFNYLGDTGVPIFRAAEAYLNYIEASYELNGNIDAKADKYWKALRQRANIDTDYNKTIQATDMTKEAELDWSAYSAGQVLSDATLFNIRRERRSELLSEGFRMDDLRRWKSMDQMMSKKYHIEGFKLWNSDYSPEYEKNNDYDFIYDASSKANVSSPSLSNYLRPYEIMSINPAFKGYGWHKAHYLNPIAVKHFIITSSGGSYGDSPIYQNPYWPLQAGIPAIE